ncbi:LexA-binding, inner membrane-associated putative hydrolase [Promicromonospora thailandica]|uniref:LexA-binding, inner membrane-associated putative hydrolase n=2 Tax=Promicromonospora thailandica TaxID=765201 RepID=A0A9X2JXY4_9MICO|nr:LexA-binding, inner membrane-associated putative hydrolase [Promicromonospora thailandica]
MMGGNHAATGAAAWVAVTASTPIAFGWYPGVSNAGVIVGSLVCAGAALLPDADHHSGTIANSLKPVSNAVARTVGKLSGGHRKGTHSILGIAVFTAIAWALSLLTLDTGDGLFGAILIGPGIMCVLLVSYALKALKITRDTKLLPWTTSITLAVLIAVFAPEEWYWMPFSVALGCTVHILGDMITTNGVPLLWPLKFRSPRWMRDGRGLELDMIWRSGGNLSIPILGDAGSVREWIFLIPVSLYAIVGIVWAFLDQMGYDTMAVWYQVVGFFGG